MCLIYIYITHYPHKACTLKPIWPFGLISWTWTKISLVCLLSNSALTNIAYYSLSSLPLSINHTQLKGQKWLPRGLPTFPYWKLKQWTTPKYQFTINMKIPDMHDERLKTRQHFNMKQVLRIYIRLYIKLRAMFFDTSTITNFYETSQWHSQLDHISENP